MLSFVRSSATNMFRAGSHLALAIAMTGATVAVTSGLGTAAYAREKAPKQNYSKGFIAVYQPLNNALTAKQPDLATVKAGVAGLKAAIETEDDRFAAGNLIYNAGLQSEDLALQRDGVGLMLQSGKVAAENLGQFNFIAGRISFDLKDYAATRSFMEAAQKAGFAQADPGVMIAEAYFAEDRVAEGLGALSQAIARKRATGEAVDPSWYNRGFVMAFNAGMGTEAADYSAMQVEIEPSKTNWVNAIGVLRMYGNYDDQGILDLMRLSKRAGSIQNQRDYADYIEAADARRLPAEVNAIVAQGISAGVLSATDVYVAEAKNISSARLAEDKKDLPALARDARAANATANTAMAAGDAYLSWNEPATAEELYAIALSKAGVDTPRVTTRLGIAQADQGKWAEAAQTFARIDGPRKAIARLWGIYVSQQAGGTAPAQ